MAVTVECRTEEEFGRFMQLCQCVSRVEAACIGFWVNKGEGLSFQVMDSLCLTVFMNNDIGLIKGLVVDKRSYQ